MPKFQQFDAERPRDGGLHTEELRLHRHVPSVDEFLVLVGFDLLIFPQFCLKCIRSVHHVMLLKEIR